MPCLKDYEKAIICHRYKQLIFKNQRPWPHTKLLYEQLKPRLSVSQKQTGSEKIK